MELGSGRDSKHAAVMAIPIEQVQSTRSTIWEIGWIGIDFNAGFDSHGFGTLHISQGHSAIAELFSLAENSHVYPMVELRYSRSRARVDFCVKLDHYPFTGVRDKFEIFAPC